MKFVHGWAFPDADEHMAAQMQPDGSYQADHLHAALRYVKRFGVAVDGGAHVGTWSKLLAARFDRVLAFEPARDTFDCLVANMDFFECANVDHKQWALGREPGWVRMTLEGFDRAIEQRNTGARFVADGDEAERVTLDSLALPALDFLKLDIEGSEYDALVGATETLRRCKPVVLFENKAFWTRYGHPKRAPQDFLTSLGAKLAETVGRDEIWIWK